MLIAKVFRMYGGSVTEIEKTAQLLQSCINKVPVEDLTRLLEAVDKNPSLVKTALKFIEP